MRPQGQSAGTEDSVLILGKLLVLRGITAGFNLPLSSKLDLTVQLQTSCVHEKRPKEL